MEKVKPAKRKGKKKIIVKMPRRMEIMKITTATMWSWDILVDSCAVCRNSLMECCNFVEQFFLLLSFAAILPWAGIFIYLLGTECQAMQKYTENVDCVIAWGVCNHAFHLHCIARWVERRCVCPLDNIVWEYRRCGNILLK